jgi:hypothetical protein
LRHRDRLSSDEDASRANAEGFGEAVNVMPLDVAAGAVIAGNPSAAIPNAMRIDRISI